MRRSPNTRRGYAMVLVLVSTGLVLALYSVAFRYVGSALRVEATRVSRQIQDEGAMHAVARGLALLETGIPPSSPYECVATIDTSTGSRDFTVTFTLESGTTWEVEAVSGVGFPAPPTMPPVF